MKVLDNLIIIATIGMNNEYRKDNNPIWQIREDLIFFEEMTRGKNIIMGKKTLETMPIKFLEGRNLFVLSNKGLDYFYDVNCFSSIENIVKYIQGSNKEFVVVGGPKIWKELMPYAATMYLTQIQEYAPADTYFPEFDPKDWEIGLLANYWNGDIPYLRKKYEKIKGR